MPKGVGGPNISWAPKVPANEAFTGDVAIQALRRRLALEPDAVPQPPIVMRKEKPFPWIARLGFVCLAAGLAAFGITALTVTDLYPPSMNKTDRFTAVSGFTPTAQSTDNPDVAPARLVVEGGRATANDPLPLGVTLKDSSGGETVFLSGLENGTRLTAGTPFGSKGWRISARDLGSVLAYAPVDYIGAMHAAINLHAANNSVVDTRVVKLEWVPKAEEAAPAAAARPVVAVAPPQPQLDPEEINRLIQRGMQLLAVRRHRACKADAATRGLGGQRSRCFDAGRDLRSGSAARNGCARVRRRTRPRPASGIKRLRNSAPAKPAAVSIAWRRLDVSAQN